VALLMSAQAHREFDVVTGRRRLRRGRVDVPARQESGTSDICSSNRLALSGRAGGEWNPRRISSGSRSAGADYVKEGEPTNSVEPELPSRRAPGARPQSKSIDRSHAHLEPEGVARVASGAHPAFSHGESVRLHLLPLAHDAPHGRAVLGQHVAVGVFAQTGGEKGEE